MQTMLQQARDDPQLGGKGGKVGKEFSVYNGSCSTPWEMWRGRKETIKHTHRQTEKHTHKMAVN